MIERKQGIIVFVSSAVGRFSIPYSSSYTASKHALQGFADCLRSEISTYNIKVMVSNPGYVATDILRNALTGHGTLHGGWFNFFFKFNFSIFEFIASNSNESGDCNWTKTARVR